MSTDARSRSYQHSGKWSVDGAAVMVLCGAVAAAVCGTVYALGIFYVPFAYLNLIGTVLLALAVGWAVQRGARAGKVRSGFMAGLGGLCAGFAALYTSWAAWINRLSDGEILPLVPGDNTLEAVARLRARIVVTTYAAENSRTKTVTRRK